MKKLLTFEEIEKLNISEIRKNYKDYISENSIKLLSYFPNGNDLIIKSEGVYIYTENKKILDLTGGNGVLGHGHNHPNILKIRREFNKNKKMEVNKLFFSKYTSALAYNLAKLLPNDLTYSFFPNSGAEAVDGAIKLAYKFHNGKRKYILSSENAFHGKLIGSGSLSKKNKLFDFQQIQGVLKFEVENLNSIKKLINENKNNIYAIILEPFSASTLQEIPTKNLLEIKKLAIENNIILIYDEVYTGWAKVGNLMNFMRNCTNEVNFLNCEKNCLCLNISPDILILSKTFGGGKSSISAFITNKAVYQKAYPSISDFSLHSTTYSGFAEEAATAIEAINIVINDDYVTKMTTISKFMDINLKELKNKFPNNIKQIHGKDLIRGIEINFDKNNIENNLLSNVGKLYSESEVRKIIVASYLSYFYSKHNILLGVVEGDQPLIRLSPSNITTQKQLDSFFRAANEVFSKSKVSIISKFVTSNLVKISKK